MGSFLTSFAVRLFPSLLKGLTVFLLPVVPVENALYILLVLADPLSEVPVPRHPQLYNSMVTCIHTLMVTCIHKNIDGDIYLYIDGDIHLYIDGNKYLVKFFCLVLRTMNYISMVTYIYNTHSYHF